MNIKTILILLRNEFLISQKSSLHYLFLFISYPLFLYLFFSIPLSLVFLDIKPIYLNWSSAGIYVVATTTFVFLKSGSMFTEYIESDYLKSLPANMINFVSAYYLYTIILGILSLIIAMIVINSLNQDFIGFINYLLIIFLFIPTIITVSNFSIILCLISNSRIYNNIFSLFFFITISFGLGSFFPLKYYPESYNTMVQYFPISTLIANVQRIISSEGIYFSLFVLSIIFSFVFTIVTIFMLQNKIKNKQF